MELRRSLITDALIAKANILVDAHLSISTEEIPKIFRAGLKLREGVRSAESSETVVDMSRKPSVGDFQVRSCYQLFIFNGHCWTQA